MYCTTRKLDDVIAEALADATAFHGYLGLSANAWSGRIVAILTKCGKSVEDEATAATFADRLHTRDLYLATSCAEGLESAWRRFDSQYRRYVQELARCLSRNALEAMDVGEGLLVDLFLPDTTGQSRIGSYDGRSSLGTWLHVIVTHRMANERVRKWNTVERPGDMPDVADCTAVGELEAGIRAARYGPAIEGSLRKACEALSPQERQMLLWRYQRGLLLEEIARRLAIHPSTVFRQLGRLQERLRQRVIANLAGTYGLQDAAISECLREVLENGSASVSLLRLIGDTSRRRGYRGDGDMQKQQIA